MEQRNRGIDLLRMTALWMVVILHILNKGGVLAAAAPLSAGQGTARLLETAAYCAVNCYGLISGYVGVQRRFRYSGALALWLRVAFFTLGITAVFACLMPGSVNGDRVLRAFFPAVPAVLVCDGLLRYVPVHPVFQSAAEPPFQGTAAAAGAVHRAGVFRSAHPAAKGRLPDGQRLQRPVAVLSLPAGRRPTAVWEADVPPSRQPGGDLCRLRTGNVAGASGRGPAVDGPDGTPLRQGAADSVHLWRRWRWYCASQR